MPQARLTIPILCIFCLVCPSMLGQSSGTNEPRAVTLSDSIEMSVADNAAGEVAHFSPDHRHFVIVTHRGNLARNSNDCSLWFFRTEDAFRSAKGQIVLKISSFSNEPAIGDVRWLNNDVLIFQGTQGMASSTQIYSFDIPAKKLKRISQFRGSILAFDTTSDLSTVAYISRPAALSFFDRASRDRGLIISTQQMADLLADTKQGGNQIHVEHRGAAPMEVPVKENGVLPSLSLSPYGRMLVVAERVPSSSDVWRAYNIPADFFLRRFLLVDTQSLSVRPLIDAPALATKGPGVVWSSDGSYVVVSSTFLPLKGAAAAEAYQRQSEGSFRVFTVEVDLNTSALKEVASGYSDLIGWDAKNSTLILHPRPDMVGSYAAPVAYQRIAGKWIQRGESTLTGAPGRVPVEVYQEEDMNTPPRVYAKDVRTGEKALVLDLNPEFRNLRFGKVEEINWKRSDGRDVKGGLYLPPDFAVGKKYPLVIQLEGWDPHKFWIDGPSTAGYAAQELAGRGFIVAQVGLPPLQDLTNVNEGPSAMLSLEGLIDDLDRRGLIDRRRVGLLGWSRTGFHVRYMLTFSTYPIAAAVIADGMDASYFQYLAWVNTGENAGYTYEQINGGVPFGDGLRSWLKHATGFNLERVRTPVWLIGFRKYSLLNNWEWFAGLKRLAKPVEMVWLPEAEHSPVRPSERLTAQGGTVDWFSFWLKEEEDRDPAKAEQYIRWRELRKLRDAQQVYRETGEAREGAQ